MRQTIGAAKNITKGYAGKLEEIVSDISFYDFLLADAGGKPYISAAIDIAANAPASLKKKKPLKFLRLAWLLFSAGKESAYAALVDEMKNVTDAAKDGKQEKDSLLGEWTFVAAYRYFREPKRLAEEFEKALKLMKAPSRVITSREPFALRMQDASGVFLRKSGTADAVSESLRRAIKLYSALTGGGGAAADVLWEADIAFLRGDTDRAEVLAYKAAYIAESLGDCLTQINASETLTRCALYRADVQAFTLAVEHIESAVKKSANDRQICELARDMAYGIIYPSLGLSGQTPEWQKNISFSLRDGRGKYKEATFAERVVINMEVVPKLNFGTAFVCHIFYFFLKGDYKRTIGAIEVMEPLWEEAGYLTLSIYSSLFKAACLVAIGGREAARAEAEKAIAAAIADGFYLMMAQFAPLLDGIVEDALACHKEAAARVAAIRGRQADAGSLLRKALKRTRALVSLGGREEEIARLAGGGMRNREIAARLSLSEQTVRNYLSAVFRKLEIKSRSELSGLLH